MNCFSDLFLFLFGFSGTTEKIFEEKKDLYDVYIDNQNVKTHRESLQPLLRLNSADREKYRKLCEQRYTSLLKSERHMRWKKTHENITPQAYDDVAIVAGRCCCTLRRWMETAHLMRKNSSFCTWWNYTPRFITSAVFSEMERVFGNGPTQYTFYENSLSFKLNETICIYSIVWKMKKSNPNLFLYFE